jgi:hypothetical protein
MKTILITGIAALLFAGCFTDKAYQAGKILYIGGKQVVIQNWDELPHDTREKLKKVDTAAQTYDELIRPAVEEASGIVKEGAE